MDLMIAIALLCPTQNATAFSSGAKNQLICQQEYISCYEEKNAKSGTLMKWSVVHLMNCVKERKIK
jgi:hypothetical protein